MLLIIVIIIFIDTNIIPKSKNNGNVQDYIYLDMLNGDDVDKFLSFEKKCISKNNRKKIPELLETNIKKKGNYNKILLNV